jgi:hypothetical protein
MKALDALLLANLNSQQEGMGLALAGRDAEDADERRAQAQGSTNALLERATQLREGVQGKMEARLALAQAVACAHKRAIQAALQRLSSLGVGTDPTVGVKASDFPDRHARPELPSLWAQEMTAARRMLLRISAEERLVDALRALVQQQYAGPGGAEETVGSLLLAPLPPPFGPPLPVYGGSPSASESSVHPPPASARHQLQLPSPPSLVPQSAPQRKMPKFMAKAQRRRNSMFAPPSHAPPPPVIQPPPSFALPPSPVAVAVASGGSGTNKRMGLPRTPPEGKIKQRRRMSCIDTSMLPRPAKLLDLVRQLETCSESAILSQSFGGAAPSAAFPSPSSPASFVAPDPSSTADGMGPLTDQGRTMLASARLLSRLRAAMVSVDARPYRGAAAAADLLGALEFEAVFRYTQTNTGSADVTGPDWAAVDGALREFGEEARAARRGARKRRALLRAQRQHLVEVQERAAARGNSDTSAATRQVGQVGQVGQAAGAPTMMAPPPPTQGASLDHSHSLDRPQVPANRRASATRRGSCM